MKEKALRRVLAARKKYIDLAKRQAEERLAAAFEFDDIRKAHADFVRESFAAGMRGEPSKRATSAHKKYISALKAHGFDERDFDFVPRCELCKDTGVADGKLCKCAKREYITALKAECGASDDVRSFVALDPSSVKDSAQREELEKVTAWLKAYVAKLPAVKNKTIVLSGGTGTGKTTLAGAMQIAAIERGKSALMLSAYDLGKLFLECHTSPLAMRNAITHDVMSADLLIIDDLGTEPVLRNVTLEYLLVLLEERLRAGLCTLITTNLGMSGIAAHYQERVASRLCDKATSRVIVLHGKDLRL